MSQSVFDFHHQRSLSELKSAWEIEKCHRWKNWRWYTLLAIFLLALPVLFSLAFLRVIARTLTAISETCDRIIRLCHRALDLWAFSTWHRTRRQMGWRRPEEPPSGHL